MMQSNTPSDATPRTAPKPDSTFAALPDDMLDGRRAGVNVLVLGPSGNCDHLIETVRADLAGPVVRWRAGQRLVLPPPSLIDVLILQGIDTLGDEDQQRLFDWMDTAIDVTVISTAGADLVRRVKDGAFVSALFYRLNAVCIPLAAA